MVTSHPWKSDSISGLIVIDVEVTLMEKFSINLTVARILGGSEVN